MSSQSLEIAQHILKFKEPVPDYRYWLTLDTWTAEQATALSFGYNPTYLKREHCLELRGPNSFGYLSRYEKIFAKFRDSVEPYVYLEPVDFIQWMKYLEWDISEGLMMAYDDYQSKMKAVAAKDACKPSQVTGTPKSDKPLSNKERTTLLTLIYAMATKGPYKYDIENPRNGAISRIETAVLDSGVSLSQRTIRDKLKDSVSAVSEQVDKKN